MPPFRVESSRNIHEEIRVLIQQAKASGRGAGFLATLKAMYLNLENSPTTFGDPTFHYKTLGMTNYVAVRDRVAINYTVDEARKIVYLRRVIWTPA